LIRNKNMLGGESSEYYITVGLVQGSFGRRLATSDVSFIKRR
jgi:hypothetical protein